MSDPELKWECAFLFDATADEAEEMAVAISAFATKRNPSVGGVGLSRIDDLEAWVQQGLAAKGLA